MKFRITLLLLFSLGLLLHCGSVTALEFQDYDYTRWSQEVTRCDELAAHSRDPGHVGTPTSQSGMDKQVAIEACHEAVANDPGNPRLNYQLGRAYGYSGRGEEAMPYRLAAVEADYPQSTFVIGYLYLLGLTIEQNTCKALELWQRSARYRRVAALVSLPRHYLRGDFDECGVHISNADLRAYLDEAKQVSSDYYIRMLADELLAKLPAVQDLAAWTSVTVGVRDLDEAMVLWVDTFGMTTLVTADGPDPELAGLWGIEPADIKRQAVLSTGDSPIGRLHLVEFNNPEPPVREGARAYDRVPKNLDVYVDDMPLRYGQLKQRGITFRTSNYSEVTAPDGTQFREIHMPAHDEINVVLLEVIGKELPFTDKGFGAIGPLVYIVADAAREKAFAQNVLQLDKLNDNLLKGPEIERMIGLPPGSGLDVSIWGRPDNKLGDIEIIEYQGLQGEDLYPRARPKALGTLHITYSLEDVSALLKRLLDAGVSVTGHGQVSTLPVSGSAYSFNTPGGLRIEIFEAAREADSGNQ